jgi:hypothetical protein
MGVVPLSVYVHCVLIAMIMLNVRSGSAGDVVPRIEIPGIKRGFLLEDDHEVPGIIPFAWNRKSRLLGSIASARCNKAWHC